jgi:aromatic ring-opening dioxygenase catalytic subunit (LigB family)
MGSGNLTHNLREIGLTDPQATKYAAEFTAWIRAHLEKRDSQAYGVLSMELYAFQIS